MFRPLAHRWAILLLWALLTAAGAAVLSYAALMQLREEFETNARIVHRLLSQRAVQHEAVMASLGLLQPEGSGAEQRLASVYPQILRVSRRDGDSTWLLPALQAAELRSISTKQPVLASQDFAAGRLELLLASAPSSFAMQLDMRTAVPWKDWPMQVESSAVRVSLEHEGQRYVLQPGNLGSSGWLFDFHKHLDASSQPFDVAAQRQVGWGELPWLAMVAWALMLAGLIQGGRLLLRQRTARQRAEELLRLGQVTRLNTLGELAAGMAHELNQPLTAILANTQAAKRLLAEDPPDLAVARQAMHSAVEQAGRASAVITRLRRAVSQPERGAASTPVVLEQAVKNALHLLQPEFDKLKVLPVLSVQAPDLAVLAEPIALEQIIHNLLTNALQALASIPAPQRQLDLRIDSQDRQGVLQVCDNGPGIPDELMGRLFEPFVTTRKEGLGLGLSLCETLAGNMGGSIAALARQPRGAIFSLTLPLASAP